MPLSPGTFGHRKPESGKDSEEKKIFLFLRCRLTVKKCGYCGKQLLRFFRQIFPPVFAGKKWREVIGTCKLQQEPKSDGFVLIFGGICH